MTRILFTEAYSASLEAIEDFIYESARDVAAVAKFVDEHDRALQFISNNPTTPAVHPATGDLSWPFGDGRYRLFFEVIGAGTKNATIYMTHIIDNRRANLQVYPGNTLPTYQDE